MQRFVLFMLVVAVTAEFLSTGDRWGRFALLPGPVGYLPELLGAAALVFVIALGIQSRFRFVRPAYWLVCGALTFTIVAGIFANSVEPGPIFAGLRNYLRAIPWFFIPAVFALTQDDLRQQLRWLLGLSLLQVPLAIEQRIKTGENYYVADVVTGDWTTGTLMLSGFLSTFLVAAACVVVGLTIRKVLKKWQGAALFLVLLLPTMINETKATLIMLPMGLVLTFLATARPGQRLKQLVLGVGAFAVFLAMFVPTYNWLTEGREYDGTIGEFFTDRITGYLDHGSEIGTTKTAGRADSARVTLSETLSDPVRAAFGVGIGNAKRSLLGAQFTGAYADRYQNFTSIGFAIIVLELGVLGFGLLMCIYWFIIRDSWFVAQHGSPHHSALAAAWVGITPFMALSLFYANVEVSATLSLLFWYFSGLIAAERMRLALRDESRDRVPRQAAAGMRSTDVPHPAT